MRISAKAMSHPVETQRSVQPKAMPASRDLLTFRQVQEALQKAGVPLCGYTIRKKIAAGILKAVKTPYRLLVPRDRLDAFIQELKSAG